jgi:hypothetical protein
MKRVGLKLTSRQTIALLSRANGLPVPVFEHVFYKGRRWRFDAAYVPERIAIEVEGGIFTNGRHIRSSGFLGDMSKYNAAALEGWAVLRYSPAQISDGAWVEDVKRALALRAA